MNDTLVSTWNRPVGAYRWLALVLAAVLMATGFAAFISDAAPAGSTQATHSVGMA